jgi:HK97 family phage portal protein
VASKSIGALLVQGLTPDPHKKSLLASTSDWLGRDISLVDGSFWQTWLGSANWSGKAVTVKSTLQLSTAMACVRLISETASTLPVALLKKDKNGTPTVATDHQLYFLLHSQPNARMSAVVFWQVFFSSLLLWGNAYVEKRTSAGVITSLEFLQPDAVSRRMLPDGTIEWRYADPITRKARVIAEQYMWHTPAFTIDGVTGISPVSYGANVLGSAMATDQASAETFKNSMKSPGIVTMDAVMTKDQRDQVRTHVRKVADEGGVMVLEKGASFQALAMNPDDAELLASRAFGVEEICRWFRVPPFMVGHAEKSTSWGTGIEQQTIGFVQYVLRPWLVRIEQSIRKDLLTPVEQLTISAEFALEGLLRGDSAARASFYSQMVNNGVMTRDECRRLENLPAMGGNAAELTVQSAMLPIDLLGQQQLAANPASTPLADALKAWLVENKQPA